MVALRKDPSFFAARSNQHDLRDINIPLALSWLTTNRRRAGESHQPSEK